MPPKKKAKFTHKKGGKKKKPLVPGQLFNAFAQLASTEQPFMTAELASDIKEKDDQEEYFQDLHIPSPEYNMQGEEDVYSPYHEEEKIVDITAPEEKKTSEEEEFFENLKIPSPEYTMQGEEDVYSPYQEEEKAFNINIPKEKICIISKKQWQRSFNHADQLAIHEVLANKKDAEILIEMTIYYNYLWGIEHKLETRKNIDTMKSIRIDYQLPTKSQLPGSGLWEFHLFYGTMEDAKPIFDEHGKFTPFMNLLNKVLYNTKIDRIVDKLSALIVNRFLINWPSDQEALAAFFAKICRASDLLQGHHRPPEGGEPPMQEVDVEDNEPPVAGETPAPCPLPDPNLQPGDLQNAQNQQIQCQNNAQDPAQQPPGGGPPANPPPAPQPQPLNMDEEEAPDIEEEGKMHPYELVEPDPTLFEMDEKVENEMDAEENKKQVIAQPVPQQQPQPAPFNPQPPPTDEKKIETKIAIPSSSLIGEGLEINPNDIDLSILQGDVNTGDLFPVPAEPPADEWKTSDEIYATNGEDKKHVVSAFEAKIGTWVNQQPTTKTVFSNPKQLMKLIRDTDMTMKDWRESIVPSQFNVFLDFIKGLQEKKQTIDEIKFMIPAIVQMPGITTEHWLQAEQNIKGIRNLFNVIIINPSMTFSDEKKVVNGAWQRWNIFYKTIEYINSVIRTSQKDGKLTEVISAIKEVDETLYTTVVALVINYASRIDDAIRSEIYDSTIFAWNTK